MQTRIVSKSIWISFSIVCMFALIAGCTGRNDNLTAVSGIVKAKGEPVSEGEIMFYPNGGGRPAIGQIKADGRYELTSFKKGDGVTAGTCKVTISVEKTTRPNSAAEPSEINEETEANMAEERTRWVIPRKYSEVRTTTLTAEVEAGKPNEINFDSADFE